MTVSKQVIDLLKNTLATNPKIQDLHLDFMHINDLLPYMELLSQLPNLKSLSLYGNRLKQLPFDLSSLPNIQSLDISNNLLNDLDMVIGALQTLPNLKELKYPIKKDKEHLVIEGLKKLTVLNELHIIRQPSKKPMALKYMNQTKLNQFKRQMGKQFRKITEIEQSYLSQKATENSEQKFMGELQLLIKEALKKLTEKEGELTQSLQIFYFNKTKYEIYDIIKNRYINIAMDIFGDIGKMIRQVWEIQHGIFETVLKEGLKLVKYQYGFIESEKDKKNPNQNLNIENKIFAKNDHLEKQIKRIKKQKDELIIEINQLQSENRRFLETLVRFSKGDKSGLSTFNQIPSHTSKQVGGVPATQSFRPGPVDKNRSGNITRQSIPSNYLSNGRNLTLKQLKETIQEIYQSKLKFDQKNFDGKIRRQTMHQYLFTHLNQKYGLKNLTIEAASSIVGGIQTYSTQDNDVAVFGKILRNEVDQQFRNVQAELKTTIYSLLKMHIKTQAPFKSVSEIDSIFKQKINGEVSSEQIQDIVKYLYNKTDSDRILQKIEILYKLNRPKQEQTTNRRFTREEHNSAQRQKRRLKFTMFLKAVLDFQMKNHEKMLKPLIVVFKSRDRDSDGIVNEDEFISIVQELCEEAKDLIPDMLMMVDPYETKLITFTQVVKLMANYPENNPILSRFIEKQYSDVD